MQKKSTSPSPDPQTNKSGPKLTNMHIQIMRGKDGQKTGHMVRHEFEAKPTKSAAFMERPESEEHMFGPKGEPVGDGLQMMAHIKKHLGVGAAPAAASQEEEMLPAHHEPPDAEEMEEEELHAGE